jgi:hypothetical protein
MTAIAAASKPIWVWNSFSTGTHNMRPCSPAPTCCGRNRRARPPGRGCSWSGTGSSGTVSPGPVKLVSHGGPGAGEEVAHLLHGETKVRGHLLVVAARKVARQDDVPPKRR